MSAAKWREFDQVIADEICDLISCNSCSLQKLIEANPHWPQKDTIYRWLNKNASFSENYALARQNQIRVLSDEIIEISDEVGNDTKLNDRVNRDRLRVDSRKWIASKLAPKLYGDKLHLAGAKDEPIEFAGVSVEDAKKRLAELAESALHRAIKLQAE